MAHSLLLKTHSSVANHTRCRDVRRVLRRLLFMPYVALRNVLVCFERIGRLSSLWSPRLFKRVATACAGASGTYEHTNAVTRKSRDEPISQRADGSGNRRWTV